MNIISSILLGYLLGCISPSAIIAKIKDTDLRSQGTENLGASNTMLVVGRVWGILVMVLDILKGFLAVRLSQSLFPQLPYVQLLSGLAAVVGHIFPFYLGFRGGKGLATFGGMILAWDLGIFLILLVIGLIGILISNHSVAMPISAGTLFPILVALRYRDVGCALVCAAAGTLIIIKHWCNLTKARSGNDLDIRKFFRNGLKVK